MGFLGESVVSLVLVAAAVLLMIKLFTKSIKWIFKLLLNTVLGYVLLFVVNFLGSWVNISIAVNWFSALVVGVLGIPGAAILILANWLMGL